MSITLLTSAEITAGHQLEIDQLTERFRGIEARSRAVEVAPEGQYVIVRCDGVKASKRYLSQVLENARFTEALRAAARSVCLVQYRFAPKWASPYIVGAALISDEVSFIVNRGPNYNKRRIWKMATTLGGALSGAMSVYMERAVRDAGEDVPEHPQLVSFDARPLLLKDAAAVDAYLRWRRLLATRNAMAKALRLGGDCSAEALYEAQPRLADDLVALAGRVEAGARWADVTRALASLRLLAFDGNIWLQEHALPGAPACPRWSAESILASVPSQTTGT